MTDRERVARAICAALCGTDDHECSFPSCGCGKPPECADAALAAMPTWRRIPDEVREGVAPFDGNPTLLWWPYWTNYPVIGYWEFGGWSSQVCLSSGPPPKHWMPLPEPPAGEVGVVAIGYANTATGGVEIDNAGIIRRAPGAGKVG